jgi:hypothetical protein
MSSMSRGVPVPVGVELNALVIKPKFPLGRPTMGDPILGG